MEVTGQVHAAAVLPPVKTQQMLNKMLIGPQSRSGRFRNWKKFFLCLIRTQGSLHNYLLLNNSYDNRQKIVLFYICL